MEQGYIVTNLLPYREKLKKEKIKNLIMLLGIFAVASIVSLFLVSSYLSLLNDSQNSRNKFIESENKKLENEIKEIATLKEDIQQTLSKRKVVENLQTNRSDSVNVLNSISELLPEGTILKNVKQQENKITIVGTTTTNSKVSNYMSSLDDSPVFINSQVIEVKSIQVPLSSVNAKKAGNNSKPIMITQSEFTINTELERKIEEEKVEKKPSSIEKK